MRSPREQGRERRPPMPLATLMGRELRRIKEGAEEPRVRWGHARLAKRGEDYFLIKRGCRRDLGGSLSSTFSVFGVFDGHNGGAAAAFARDHLLDYILRAIPSGLNKEEWMRVLPEALVAGFVKTDIELESQGESSGTTATLAVVDGLTVTVASVGDSRCILDSCGGTVSALTVDHRLEESPEERERLITWGAEVARMNICGRREVGPLRCWPGGLCLSRSIGDADVGEFILPIPHVKQVRIPDPGGRLIIASDGVWDALSSEAAAKSCRRLSPELAAKQVVKEAVRSTGLKDDTTCLVVDIGLPEGGAAENKSKGSFLFWKRPKLSPSAAVVELFEEGSPWLSHRLKASSYSGRDTCAICRAELAAVASEFTEGELLSLCPVCQRKKDAMEGKLLAGEEGGAAGEGGGDDVAFAAERLELLALVQI